MRSGLGKSRMTAAERRVPRGLRKVKASPLRGESGLKDAVRRTGRSLPSMMPRALQATMPNAGFVHLHVHSAYSLLKGSIKIAKLGELAKADRQPALALTDTDNMFGALEFSDKMAGYGIQPIIGCELAIDFGDSGPQRAQRAGRGAVADRAAGGARARLSQPDAAELAGVPGDARPSIPAHQVRMARRRCRGPDRADRRPGRADLAGAATPIMPRLRPRAASGWRACSATASISNCSATASTRSAASKPA